MSERIENAKDSPEVFYGLHMVPGVAEYKKTKQNPDQPLRVYLSGETCVKMDQSFPAKPVVVRHIDEDVENMSADELAEIADGWVVESFYNKFDGCHWAKFVITSNQGLQAIKNNKWKLSNCYIPVNFAGGGECHGVSFQKEITDAKYEHLAIVPDPRYEESIILTPEEFKTYNAEKEVELLRVSNSKGESKMNFWKREALKNSKDLEDTIVTLPLTGKEMSIAKLVNEMDEHYKKDEGKDPNAPAMANGDHMVKIGDSMMKVNELAEKYCAMKSSMDDAEAKKKAMELAEHEEKEMKAKKENGGDEDMGEKKAEKDKKDSDKTENADDEEKDKEKKKNGEGLDGGEKEGQKQKKEADKTENKKKNEEDEEKEKHKNSLLHFEALKNAKQDPIVEESRLELSDEKVARGKSRYGSGN